MIIGLTAAATVAYGLPAAAQAPDLEPAQVSATPAPVRQWPICEELFDPDARQCLSKNDVNTASATGALSANGTVEVTITPLIPPCTAYEPNSKTWTPDTCYSRIIFGTHGSCRYYSDNNQRLEYCHEPEFQDGTYAGSHLFHDGLERSSKRLTANGLVDVNTCGANSAFNVYGAGGPPGLTWPDVAPTALSCTLAIDRTPDNLFGATWHVFNTGLVVQKSGNPDIHTPWAQTFYTVEGFLGPLAPDPIDPEPVPDPEYTPVGPFTDVRTSSFARADIELLYDLGITTGISATEYGPSQPVTRAQMASFLARIWRSLGNTCGDGPAPFDDVATTSFAYDDTTCIFALGITTGVAPRTYDPNGLVTREQMAAFLARGWRAVGGTCAAAATGFVDVPASSFAAADIECIFALGVTTGTSPTTYAPADTVTREQMAAFLGRMYRAATA